MVEFVAVGCWLLSFSPTLFSFILLLNFDTRATNKSWISWKDLVYSFRASDFHMFIFSYNAMAFRFCDRMVEFIKLI